MFFFNLESSNVTSSGLRYTAAVDHPMCSFFFQLIKPYTSKTGQNIYLDLLEFKNLLDSEFMNLCVSYI